ncbi:helix-turn-helix domain-containing protein [Paenibacillus beijingensis]|uniref:AraC family transcriptional regulator n=1 Tax=Paenibacillus beijingensis TaxID=1126833 RepID=A0A0D5NIF7_9BACL|nr:helix-turn-helix domain-containing protein [Paenibacillus beijingensis]AJY74757.1 AraC family transcriptional regulator [Paenibacillus beijingensis]
MHNTGNLAPQRNAAPYRDWSPSVHYAQFQTVPTGKLRRRRIYDFELLYVCDGEAATVLAGKRYAVAAGQMIFIPAGIPYYNEIVSAPNARFLGIHFDFFDELDFQTDVDMIVNEATASAHRFGTEAVAESFEPLSERPLYTPSLGCVQLMEQVVHEFSVRAPGYKLVCKALMLQILGMLLRSQQSCITPQLPVQDERVLGLIASIEAAPARRWSNQMLAERLAMNKDHMIKVFKKATGVPPGEYVQMLRHREARILLQETNLAVEEIGIRVGYPDIHYFSRLFRKREGVSPRAYRNLSRML